MNGRLVRAMALLAVVLGLAATLPGCWRKTATPVARAAEDSTTGYGWDGQSSGYAFRAPLPRTEEASLAAFKRLGFTADTAAAQREARAITLLAADARGITARVELRTATDARTEIKARIGSVGDRSASERLLDEIARLLRETP